LAGYYLTQFIVHWLTDFKKRLYNIYEKPIGHILCADAHTK